MIKIALLILNNFVILYFANEAGLGRMNLHIALLVMAIGAVQSMGLIRKLPGGEKGNARDKGRMRNV